MLTTERIYHRGLNLYENGEVKGTRVKGIFGVHGYIVDMNRETCTCPSHTHKPDMVCKHQVAAARRMLDDLRYPAA